MSNPSFVPTTRSKKTGAGGRKTNKLFLIIGIASAIIAAGVVLFMLLKISETVKYYVVAEPIAARSPITPELLTEVVAPVGSVPPNALSLEFISENELFAAYALQEGEVVSLSVVQEQTPILADVPDDYVAVSITIPANYAVAGKIARDDIVDVIATNSETNITKVVLRGVRILDTAATLEVFDDEEEEGEGDSESASVRAGIPTIYTVALTPIDAVKLSAISEFPLTLVLTDPDTLDEEETNVQMNLEDIFSDEGVGLSGGFNTVEDEENPDGEEGENPEGEEGEDGENPEGEEDPEGAEAALNFYKEEFPDSEVTIDDNDIITIDGPDGIMTVGPDSDGPGPRKSDSTDGADE